MTLTYELMSSHVCKVISKYSCLVHMCLALSFSCDLMCKSATVKKAFVKLQDFSPVNFCARKPLKVFHPQEASGQAAGPSALEAEAKEAADRKVRVSLASGLKDSPE